MSQAYDLLIYHAESEKKNNAKYFGFSLFFHFVMISASLFVVVPEVEKLQKEIITVEYHSNSKSIDVSQTMSHLNASSEISAQPALKKMEAVSESHSASNSDSEMDKAFAKAQSDLNHELDQLKSNSTVSKVVEIQKIEKQNTSTQKTKIQSIKAQQLKSRVSKFRDSKKGGSGRRGVPQNLEDIKIPELSAEGVIVPEQGQLGDEEFESSFKKIDQKQNSLIAKHQKEFDEQIQNEQLETDSQLKNIERQNQQESQGLEKSIQDAKVKNAAKLNQVKQDEQDAISAAAQAQAKKWAQKQFLAQQQAKKASSEASGSNAESSGTSGIPSGVRSLDQLRQMPGNPKPAYSIQERKERHQGQVIFYAYITKTGVPTEFKLSQSTGYRNLDGKTLSALKKWKFYPGQEGWVEIPFKWDIVGGVSEMPTMLRRVGTR